MQKAISVLLSWVLIVGFAVAMSAIIFGWAIPFVNNISNKLDTSENVDIYCDNTQIKILDICRRELPPSPGLPDPYSNRSINISIQNTGSYSIKRLSISRETTHSAIQSCFMYLTNPIEPGSTTSFDLAMLASFIDSNGNNLDCITLDPEPLQRLHTGFVKQIEITPYVNINNQEIPCSSSRVTTKDINILNHWCIIQ